MVAAKVAGASTAAIARAEGLSRDWTAAELASSESRQILAGLVAETMGEIRDLYKLTLKTIRDGMNANKVVLDKGRIRNLGGDPFARLTAAKRFLELVTVGRPTPHTPDEGDKTKTITLEELERIVKENKKAVVQ